MEVTSQSKLTSRTSWFSQLAEPVTKLLWGHVESMLFPMLFYGTDWLNLPLSFTKSCRFRPLRVSLQLRSISALLGGDRSGKSCTKWPGALQWKQPCCPLTLCDLYPDSLDSVTESCDCLANSDLKFAKSHHQVLISGINSSLNSSQVSFITD